MSKDVNSIPNALGLRPVKGFAIFRRWVGIYTQQEREVIEYNRRIKEEAIAITKGKGIAVRPSWMRIEDFRDLRKFAQRVQRSKKYGK